MQNDELRQAQLEIESSRTKYYRLYDFAPVGFFTMDPDGRIVEANYTFTELLGRPLAEIVNRFLSAFVSEEYQSTLYTHLSQLLETKLRQTCQLALVAKDGARTYVQLESSPELDDTGNVIRILSAAANITKQYQAEIDLKKALAEQNRYLNALQEERTKLEAITANAPVAIIVFDKNSRITFVNPAASDLYGNAISPGERMDQPAAFHHFTSEGTHLKSRDLPFIRAIQTGVTLRNQELLLFRPDKQKRYLLVNTRPLIDDSGGVTGAVTALKDITELKARENQLRRTHEGLEERVRQRTEELMDAKQNLERSNRELQDFAFAASHDLQEPLRKIQSFGDLLQKEYGESLGAKAIDFLQRMQNASARMQNLIKGLLNYSRVTTKAQPYVPVDLNKAAQEALSNLEVSMQRIHAVVEMDHLPSIEADFLQMTLLFQNLIGNAIKFTRDGVPPKVKVYSSLTGNRCEVAVEDNGIGFDEEYAERIFAPFEKLHGMARYEGAGIGLAICRKIVERHGGTISARSSPGKGATFIVTLPVKQQQS
jgi:PAS domain S-box-containing protein